MVFGRNSILHGAVLEAIYLDVQRPIGFLRSAKAVPAKGSLFSARERLHREGIADTPAQYKETELQIRSAPLQSFRDIQTTRSHRRALAHLFDATEP